jgi:hypothetical protein
MKCKQIISLILIFAIALQLPIYSVKAQTIYSSEIEVSVENELSVNQQDITPHVTITWEQIPQTTKNEIIAEHSGIYQGVQEFYYELVLRDVAQARTYTAKIEESVLVSGAAASIVLNKDTPLKLRFENDYEIENGKLYTAQIVARYRANFYEDDGAGGVRLAYFTTPMLSQTTEVIPFVTDFNTQVIPSQERVHIEWEYIPEASYILYWTDAITPNAEGINVTREDIMGKVAPITISPEMARSLLDTETNKVVYSVPNTGGSIYAAFVEQTGGIQIGAQTFSNIERGSDPKVAVTISQALLQIEDIDADRIRLKWQIPDWLNIIISGGDVRIEVYARGSDGNSRKVQDIPSLVNETVLARPKEETIYYIRIIDADNGITIQSNERTSGPYEIKEKPVRPRIPFASNRDVFDGLQTGEGSQYVVQAQGENVISNWQRFKERAFYADLANEEGIQLVWENLGQDFDHSLRYDIWVTTDRSSLDIEGNLPTYPDVQFEQGNTTNVISANGEPIGLRYRLHTYTNNQGQKVNIIPNRTYYIQLVAKKSYRDGYVASEPNIVSITIGPTGEISTPPILSKPPLKLDAVTSTQAVIKWRESWYEILATLDKQVEYEEGSDERLLAEMGSAKVYTGSTSPEIRFVSEEGLSEHILLQQGNVNNVKNAVGSTYDLGYYDRRVDLGSDVSYELKVLPYNTVLQDIRNNYGSNLTIENWVKEQGNGSSANEAGWQSITPTTQIDEGNLEWQFHSLTNLLPNTTYVVMIRAYRVVDGERKVQTFPSYILATTLTDYEGPEPTPTVPILALEGIQDTSISVSFKYNKNFDYQIVYSRLDNPNAAATWEFEVSDDPTNENYVADGGRALVTINGLFPETTYNIWIKAKQKVGTDESDWSNPVTAKTREVGIPTPPTGLGLAAYQSILEANQDFAPLGSDYITVEWVKNPNDLGDVTEGSMQKAYTYILEFADNVEFLDSITIETTDNGLKTAVNGVEALSKTLVRVNNLIANRPYYVRVKTKITVSDTQGTRTISRESEYTSWVRIITSTSTEEYDGGENDNIVIYPEKTKETYQNGIWTIEVLDTQKVISELVNQNAYFYTLDMRLYNGKIDATTRRIRIPKPLLDALANRGMELRVITHMGSYQLPVRAIQYYLEGGSSSDRVQIDFATRLAYDLAGISKQYPYTIQKAEALSIQITGKQPVAKLDGMIRVEQKLANELDYINHNVQGFTFDYSLGSWIKENQSIQFKEDGTYLSYATSRVGIYATYHLENYAQQPQNNSSMQYLLSQYAIVGLGEPYGSSNTVTSNQFIQLVLGIAQNQSQINLLSVPNNTQITRVNTAGLYMGGQKEQITREEAIVAAIRLYELKNGRAVKATTSAPASVGLAYRDGVAKALSLGLVSVQDLNPKNSITYGELCDLIVQVLP